MKIAFICTFLLMYHTLSAQGVIFQLQTQSNVTANGIALRNAWAGGLNTVQANQMDINGDSFQDLILFDAYSRKLSVFLFSNNSYIYQPAYENYFPEIDSWMVMADYNCDGKKDIFTRDKGTLGVFRYVKVWKNISNTSLPGWRLQKNQLFGSGVGNFNYDLIVGVNEFPSVIDIDNDGDLDFFSYNGANQIGVEFFRNLSKDVYGTCDSLVFEKYSSCYGKFLVGSNCNNLIALNQRCTQAFGGKGDPVSRIQHLGSYATLFDVNKDGKIDIVTSDLNCNNAVLLTNGGSNLHASITGVLHTFPTQNPIIMPEYPLVQFLDINADGKSDIIAGPNILSATSDVDLKQSLWYYQDTSMQSTEVLAYKLISKNFLQSTMIEVGENANPSLTDYDGDGDLDLFVSNKGTLYQGLYRSTVLLYENMGNKTEPRFVLKDEDFLTLSGYNYRSLKPRFADINGDSSIDMYFLSYDNIQGTTLQYVLNSNPKHLPYRFDLNQRQALTLRTGGGNFLYLTEFDHIFMTHLNSDSLIDVLVSRSGGQLLAFFNNGTKNSPNLQLTHSEYAGVSLDPDRQFPCAILANLHHPDTTEMLLIDERGMLKVYKHFSFISQTANLGIDSNVIYNPLDGFAYSLRAGSVNSIEAGDLNGDGYKDLLIGTAGGGILWLENLRKKKPVILPPKDSTTKPIANRNPDSKNEEIFFYPNPTSGSVTLFPSGYSVCTISDLNGNTLRTYILNNIEPISVEIGNQPGLYILKLYSEKNIVHRKVYVY